MALRIVLLFIIINDVAGQICNKTISVSREVPETYQYTYLEAYQHEGECWECCTKSRQASNIGTRLVKKFVNETTSVCCEGYTEDLTVKGNGLHCIPVCNPPCINGYCRQPNECACEWGFALDPNDPLNNCVPLCLEGCDLPGCLPTCAPPNFGILEPLGGCKNCHNGTCIAPGKCQCDDGFKLTEDGGCEPICSCEHGTCSHSGVCSCDPGWLENNGVCHPICIDCDHGNCTAPGRCVCDAGYKSDKGKCVPFCSKGCINGNCIGPEICTCDPGWYLSTGKSVCLPHCDGACGNGSCIAPNLCKCSSGYGGQHCEPICSNCEGSCVAPGVCKLLAFDSVPKQTTVNSSECDWFDFFADRKCIRKYSTDNSDAKTMDLNKITNISYDLDEVFPKSDELIANISTKLFNDKANDTICPYSKNTDLSNWYHWIYGAVIIAELLVIIMLIFVVTRKHFNRIFEPKHTNTSCDGATVRYISSLK